MSQIYSQAQGVITYLGPSGSQEQEHSEIRLLERIFRNIPEATWNYFYEAGGVLACRDRVLDGTVHMEPLPADIKFSLADVTKDEIKEKLIELGWDWLVRVAYGEWAQRLWIVQEQILNPNIIALRGHRLISWEAVATTPILFGIGYLPEEYYVSVQANMVAGSLPRDTIEQSLYGTWWERRARLTSDYEGSELVENIDWYSQLLCRDPRDRVYAVLAVSVDSNTLDLTPDYTPGNDIERLILEFSVRALTHASHLQLLNYASMWRQPDSRLPSWCFMFNNPSNVSAPPPSTALDAYAPHPMTSTDQPVARVISENSILIVKGRIIDAVCTSRKRTTSISSATSAIQEMDGTGTPNKSPDGTKSSRRNNYVDFIIVCLTSSQTTSVQPTCPAFSILPFQERLGRCHHQTG
jgi:hypothetical protein